MNAVEVRIYKPGLWRVVWKYSKIAPGKATFKPGFKEVKSLFFIVSIQKCVASKIHL